MSRELSKSLCGVMALVFMTTLDVLAQEPPKLWVTGAGVVSFHDPGDSDIYLFPAFGGHAPGVVVGMQVPIRPRLRAGYEVSYDAVIEGEQSQRTGLSTWRSFLTTHRDTTITGLLAWAWAEGEDRRFAPTFLADLRWHGDIRCSTSPRQMLRSMILNSE
jgi:hypothetical protein